MATDPVVPSPEPDLPAEEVPTATESLAHDPGAPAPDPDDD